MHGHAHGGCGTAGGRRGERGVSGRPQAAHGFRCPQAETQVKGIFQVLFVGLNLRRTSKKVKIVVTASRNSGLQQRGNAARERAAIAQARSGRVWIADRTRARGTRREWRRSAHFPPANMSKTEGTPPFAGRKVRGESGGGRVDDGQGLTEVLLLELAGQVALHERGLACCSEWEAHVSNLFSKDPSVPLRACC